jgi:glutaminyl-peptide cyclotransferase
MNRLFPITFARPWLQLLVIALALAANPSVAKNEPDAPPLLAFEVVARYPHGTDVFTQGLELDGGALYMSSGLYGRSFIARAMLPPAPPAPALTDARQPLPPQYFGEGLTVWRDRIYVLTWREHRGLIFDRATLRPAGEFAIEGEGWGLAHDERHLILSDGTARLRFLEPDRFTVQKTITVRSAGQPLEQLNELEWIDATGGRPGRLLANVWQTDELVVIDPADGRVTARLDLRQLYPRGRRSPHADVLNGIAWDPRDGTLLVTGKFWPHLYRIRLLQPLP